MKIEDCRGVQSFETTDGMTLLRAPYQSVVEALTQTKRIKLLESNIYARSVTMSSPGFVVFQFHKHPWTIIRDFSIPSYTDSDTENDAQELSSLLNTSAVVYYVSDTFDEFSYKVYSAGVCVERLFASAAEGSQFESKLHPSMSNIATQDPEHFTDTFFKEQNIYVPVLQGLSLPTQLTDQPTTLKFWSNISGKRVQLDHSCFEGFCYLALKI